VLQHHCMLSCITSNVFSLHRAAICEAASLHLFLFPCLLVWLGHLAGGSSLRGADFKQTA
jgi:hypothetical protein